MKSDQSIYNRPLLRSRSPVATLITTLITTLIVFAVMSTFALNDASARELQTELFQEHINALQVGMPTLGGWATTNMVVGGVMRQRSTGTARYFHEMNAGWNIVNLGIAAFGYLSLPDVSAWSNLEALTAMNKIDRILLFNAGLDLGYIALGYGLLERGRRTESSRMLGYGQSIMVQGAALFLFDAIFAYSHSHLTEDLRIKLVSDGTSLALIGSF